MQKKKNCECESSVFNDTKSVNNKAIFDCRESGSTLRFFIPVASVFCDECEFVGSKRLLERGVGIYEKTLGENGVSVQSQKDEIVVSGRLKSGTYTLDGNMSSQYVSGLMFALPLLDGDSKIIVREPVESRAYIDLTTDVLKKVGIEIVEEQKKRVFDKRQSKIHMRTICRRGRLVKRRDVACAWRNRRKSGRCRT